MTSALNQFQNDHWWLYPPKDFDLVLFFGDHAEARHFARECKFGFEEQKLKDRPYLVRVLGEHQIYDYRREKTIYCFGDTPHHRSPFELEAEKFCSHRYHFFEKSKILEIANAHSPLAQTINVYDT